MNGEKCMADAVGEVYKFKCPANCWYEGRTFRQWQVGDKTIYREPYVVGGPDVYRGDSFICVAALHAGVISARTGGCGTLQWIGPHSEFPSTLSADGKMSSMAFDTVYPVNFRFIREECGQCRNKDIREWHIAVNVAFVFLIAYFATSPGYFLFSLVAIGYWTVVLASNPPWSEESVGNETEVFSLGLGRFLPCMLSTMYIYQFATRPLMTNMQAHLTRAVLFGTAFVMGILENYVFGRIPVDRLMIQDLRDQSGALIAFLIIVVIVGTIIISQAYMFWVSGKFQAYFPLYCAQALALMLFCAVPHETLRIHHYILALLLLPGTCLQTGPSVFYQGLLLGLYVSGVARWDFAPVLQSERQLSRGTDMPLPVDPFFLDPVVTSNSYILKWQGNPNAIYNGYSLTINDVERYRARATSDIGSFNLTAWVTENDPDRASPAFYVRVAAAAIGKHNVQYHGKFSDAIFISDESLGLI